MLCAGKISQIYNALKIELELKKSKTIWEYLEISDVSIVEGGDAINH